MSSMNEAIAQPQFTTTSIETSIKDKNRHHQRSLPKGQMVSVKISPAANVQWRVYKITTDINVMMLTGNDAKTGSSAKIAKLMTNKNQILSYCVAALSYARIYAERSWKPEDIDKIIDIGWNINRRALRRRPMNLEQETDREDVTDVFYIDSIKFVTLTKASTDAGIICISDLSSLNIFFAILQEKGQDSCVVEFNANYISFWNSGDKYFIFHPMSFYHTTAKCVQLTTFDCVRKYMLKVFVDPNIKYSFHSVEILRVNNQLLCREEVLKDYYQELTRLCTPKRITFPDEKLFTLSKIPHKICLLPNDQHFFEKPSSYEFISTSRDILRCPKSIDGSAKIPSTSVAALIMLRVSKSFYWTSNTLDDILGLGTKIFKENLKLKTKGHNEIQVSDITQKIEFRSFQCLIESHQIFFGKVESPSSSISQFEQILNQFFRSYIAGIIDGPNIVTIWNEGNYYCMYDAKARDRFGGKWTKEANNEESGMSCVTRFLQLKDLVEVYVQNVPQKQRLDYYKITQIDLKPFLGKNWFEWKVILSGQWCLRAKEYADFKSTFSTSVISLLYAENVPMKNWTSNLIDEIASTGCQYNDYFKPLKTNYDMNDIEKEITFQGTKSIVHINQKIFRYVVSQLDKNIEDDLIKGFGVFFEANKRGIFSYNTQRSRRYFSIWQSSGNWFVFGLHTISDEGMQKTEITCALRFVNHIDLVKSLITEIIIRKNQEFSLSRVTFSQDHDKNRKINNYTPLTTSNRCAGILRIGENIDLAGVYDNANTLKNTHHLTTVLAMTLIKDCWTWSSYDVWDFFKISQKSFSDRFKEFEKFSAKVGNTTIKISEVQKRFAIEASSEEMKNLALSEKGRKENISNVREAVYDNGRVEGIKKELLSEEYILRDTEFGNYIGNAEGNNSNTIQLKSNTNLKSEDQDYMKRSIIGEFLHDFYIMDLPYAILKSRKLHYAIWKKDGSYFIFDGQDADANGVTKNQRKVSQDSEMWCPYVAWFESFDALLEHIILNESVTDSRGYELTFFKFKTKVEKSTATKSWYNFSLIDDTSNQWVIRSLYASLESNCGLVGCIIALAFASVLQPSDWNSSMLDSSLKYGMKLYKKSIRTDTTKNTLKLKEIITPFIIGCYEFSFITGLFKCGANEYNFLENGLVNLFTNSQYGIISSKGYSAAIWKQNNSYFMFDPHINGMACLSRFPSTELISKHFLSHVSFGMTGVNVFEIHKVLISMEDFKKKNCPIDVNAIRKLTNRSAPIDNKIINQDINTLRMFGNVSGSSQWIEFKENPPTECYVVAANLMSYYKSPDFWTTNEVDEILNLGKKILRTTAKKFDLDYDPKTLHIQPFQIQGMYPFDKQNSVNIRMETFKRVGSKEKHTGENNKEFFQEVTEKLSQVWAEQNQETVRDASEEHKTITEASCETITAVTLKDQLKATLIKFFEIWDNAFLTTEDATVTAWKQGNRFYLFYCQPIDDQGRLTKFGESKGALFTFININELYEFLVVNFGSNGLRDWFEIRHLDLTFVPSDACSENEKYFWKKKIEEEVHQMLRGPICQCSPNFEKHIQKHPALCLAAIIISTIHKTKNWSIKTLSQIEAIGKDVHDDAILEKRMKQISFMQLPRTLYVEQVEYRLNITNEDEENELDESTLNTVLTQCFERSSTLYFSIETTSLSLMTDMGVFYTYNPCGVYDQCSEVRSSLCCFSTLDSLINHLLKIGDVLQTTTFLVNCVNVVAAEK